MCWAKYNFLSSHCLLALVKIYRGYTSIVIGNGFLKMTLISNHVILPGSHILYLFKGHLVSNGILSHCRSFSFSSAQIPNGIVTTSLLRFPHILLSE